MKRFFHFFRNAAEKTPIRESLKKRFAIFQHLLTSNNQALSLMADMEEKLSGEGLFDRQYIDASARLVSEKVSGIINDLNTLSEGKYRVLHSIYDRINNEVEKMLLHEFEVPVSDFIIPVKDLRSSMSNIAGGKMANLGEMKDRLNLRVPEGFVITAHAFETFLAHNDLREKITRSLSTLNVENMEQMDSISRDIQHMIIEAALPAELEHAIQKAYADLNKEIGEEVKVSVRSSAVREDGEASFAGQYETFLNVRGEDIADKYREVVASLFTPKAIFYYKTQGFSEEELVMAVGVLRMIDALSAGVAYTNDPNDPGKNVMVINALLGLGKSVVDGTAEPDTYIIEKNSGAFLGKNIKMKHRMVVCADGSDTKEIAVPLMLGNEQSITDEQLFALYECAMKLEIYYGRPQDIEWAVDHRDRLYILQTRPLEVLDPPSSQAKRPSRIDGRNILVNEGVIACRGVGYGKAFLLRNEKELMDIPDGAVLVARHTNTKFVKVMNKVSAIITDVGGITGHMASLSREYHVPTILNTGTSTTTIRSGQEVTVDAFNCYIYEGRVDELLEYARKKKESGRQSYLHRKLGSIVKLISPLTLVDPDKDYFSPEHCRTLHDITRFAHETAMAEIFQTGKGFEIDGLEDFMSAIAFAESGETKDIELQSTILKIDIPVEARLIDIDGGLKKKKKKAAPEDITSVPFSAFLKGLTAMRWPGPAPGGPRTGFGSAAQISSLTKEQLRRTQEKSYAIISRNHMNFSIRLGYHFSMVEAYAGENMNDNYIKFFFKGGGAVQDRKMRRVRLIKEILESMHFHVNVIDDCVDAMLTKYTQSDTERLLEIMGKFTVYTKQLDMAMFNDDVADMFIEDFIRDHVKH